MDLDKDGEMYALNILGTSMMPSAYLWHDSKALKLTERCVLKLQPEYGPITF